MRKKGAENLYVVSARTISCVFLERDGNCFIRKQVQKPPEAACHGLGILVAVIKNIDFIAIYRGTHIFNCVDNAIYHKLCTNRKEIQISRKRVLCLGHCAGIGEAVTCQSIVHNCSNQLW